MNANSEAADVSASLAELQNRLNRAYLSGDGEAVEQIMSLITAAQRRQLATAQT